ncbi:probable BOI-related E3 ubiquitin-protein ligase 3 [Sorghum bicolor]|uniref:probable BOI-related E3 ubiquitin-protein ligase 3 n=1 Tax=Sorghum bicolor TaxID=4558 RepID=UPI000B42623B|nr:probable BOI-related E3 ubiquitin-protein ligase 3 [Sorghum bicolor]|eukprot:XP_002450892.2 probable BOI-related E3 ubiquitin-protein ligase 3 [Sorghum bicolor]
MPIPGMHMQQAIAGHQLLLPALVAATTAGRLAESATTSTSGRPGSGAHVLASELQRQHSAEIDALVRAECDLLRAGLEQARKRQCDALARAAAAAAAAAPALREVEAELAAALRRAADLEELLREAAAECQAWCGLARSNGAVAAGLRAAIDAVLRQGAGGAGTALPAVVEGFGDSGGGTDDAQSCWCCYEEEQAAETAAASASASSSSSWNWNGRWACKACGEGEASVLLLPCRHLCLCKACERRTEACPVCLATKNACIHVAAD